MSGGLSSDLPVTLAPYHLSYGVRVTDGLLIIVLYVVVSSAAITLAPPLRQTRSSTCRDRVGWVITCGAGAASCGLDGSGAFSLGPSGFHLPAACRRLTPLVDIRAITAYCEDIAPDPGSCTLEIQGTVQDRSFLIRVGAVKALRPSKGQEPAGANFSHRDLSRRTGYPVRHIPY